MSEENNMLISQFMGWKQDVKFGHMVVIKPGYEGFYYDAMLRFHESWDWLMPVVEKIAKDFCYDVYITADGLKLPNHACVIGTTTQIYAEAEGSFLMETVYTAVVKFIKFHNSTQNNP